MWQLLVFVVFHIEVDELTVHVGHESCEQFNELLWWPLVVCLLCGENALVNEGSKDALKKRRSKHVGQSNGDEERS